SLGAHVAAMRRVELDEDHPRRLRLARGLGRELALRGWREPDADGEEGHQVSHVASPPRRSRSYGSGPAPALGSLPTQCSETNGGTLLFDRDHSSMRRPLW